MGRHQAEASDRAGDAIRRSEIVEDGMSIFIGPIDSSSTMNVSKYTIAAMRFHNQAAIIMRNAN